MNNFYICYFQSILFYVKWFSLQVVPRIRVDRQQIEEKMTRLNIDCVTHMTIKYNNDEWNPAVSHIGNINVYGCARTIVYNMYLNSFRMNEYQ